MLPTFVVIGAAKAGTTSLHGYLRSHPEVFVSAVKELNFFIAEMNWERGLAWYEEQFADAGSALAVGEVSPLYSAAHWYRGVPERMASVIPAAKLVYVVRHPVERMRSHYLMHLDLEREWRPPERALRENEGYLSSSMYAAQLERYLEYYSRDRVLVLVSEDLRHRRTETLARLFDFIGVDRQWDDDALREERHRSDAKEVRLPVVTALRRRPGYDLAARIVPPYAKRLYGRLTTRRATGDLSAISPALEAELVERLRPDLARLRDLVAPDFHAWGLLDEG